MMNINHLRYFLIVAEKQSISRAAQELHFKQQYLSSIIKKLEEDLDIVLFDRKSRGVELTKDGEYLREKASEVIKIIDEIELAYLFPSKSEFREATDELTVYTVPLIEPTYLSNVLFSFETHFPHVNVHIVEETRKNIIELILNEKKSIALTLYSDDEEIEIPEGIVSIPLLDRSFVAATRKSNPYLDNKFAMKVNELLNQPLIIYAPKGIENSTLQRFLKMEQELDIKYIVENPNMFVSLLLSGNYFSIVNSHIKIDDSIVFLPLEDLPIAHVYLMTHEKNLNYFLVKSFINLLLQEIGCSFNILTN